MPDMTKAFMHIAINPFTIIDCDNPYFKHLERFTVVMSNRSSLLEHIADARMALFYHSNKLMENLPPTRNALSQHCKWVVYLDSTRKLVNRLS